MLAKIKVNGSMAGKMTRCKMVASERMNRKEVKEEYERRVCKRLTEARLIVEEGVTISEVFRMYKGAVAVEVVGYRHLRVQRKGNA